MDKFNLDEVWKDSDNQANEYYNEIEPKVLEMARKSSHSILSQLRNTIFWEWTLSTAALIVLLIVVRDMPYLSWIIGACVISSIAIWIPYRKLLKKIEATPTHDMLSCITTYIEILNRFIKQIRWLSYIFMPIGLLFGLIICRGIPAFDVITQNIYLVVFTIVVVLFTTFWSLDKWYIPKLYGEPKQELEELLASLRDKE